MSTTASKVGVHWRADSFSENGVLRNAPALCLNRGVVRIIQKRGSPGLVLDGSASFAVRVSAAVSAAVAAAKLWRISVAARADVQPAEAVLAAPRLSRDCTEAVLAANTYKRLLNNCDGQIRSRTFAAGTAPSRQQLASWQTVCCGNSLQAAQRRLLRLAESAPAPLAAQATDNHEPKEAGNRADTHTHRQPPRAALPSLVLPPAAHRRPQPPRDRAPHAAWPRERQKRLPGRRRQRVAGVRR